MDNQDMPADWACNKCTASFTPTPHQVRTSSHECANCKRARERAYRVKRKEAGNPIKSSPNPSQEERAAYEKAYWSKPENQERRRLNQKRNLADPDRKTKHLARSAVNHAIASGKLARHSCEICGTSSAEAHHDDYSRPLDVRWLCRTHHRQHHFDESRALRRGMELAKEQSA